MAMECPAIQLLAPVRRLGPNKNSWGKTEVQDRGVAGWHHHTALRSTQENRVLALKHILSYLKQVLPVQAGRELWQGGKLQILHCSSQRSVIGGALYLLST